MAQPIETAATVADDYDAICRVVQLCLDGESTGSVEKLREAFHEDARMFGLLAGERYDVPIRSSLTWWQAHPGTLGTTAPGFSPCTRPPMPRS